MPPDRWDELRTLSERFDQAPGQLSLAELSRYEAVLGQLADDPETPAARRLLAVLTRASVRDYRLRDRAGGEG